MIEAERDKTAGECPVVHGKPKGTHMPSGLMTYKDWWPNQLNLKILHQQSAASNPMARRSTTRENSRSSTSLP